MGRHIESNTGGKNGKILPKCVGDFPILYLFQCLILFLTKHHSIDPSVFRWWSKLSIYRYVQPCLGSILIVFYKYITTAINTCKKLFDFGQREVISFFTLVTNKGEHLVWYYFITNKTAMGLDKKLSQLMDCPLPTNNTHNNVKKNSTYTNVNNINTI